VIKVAEIPKNITEDDIIEAIKHIDENGYDDKYESTGYDLVYKGKSYPPKYVISKANKFANGSELPLSEFNGGNPTNGFLRKLGFEISTKNDTPMGDNMGHELKQEQINSKYDELKETGQIEFITFHPSYSYEEFVEGITVDVDKSGKPTDELKYKLKQGIFKQMATSALIVALDPDQERDLNGASFGTLMGIYRQQMNEITTNLEDANKRAAKIKEWWENVPRYVLIIDEINRGDISKIFGELITLLESDKRLGMENELTVKLPYSQDEFAVPPNLYIIGTMNTADKSIALIDVALRRRFGFIEMSPDLEILKNEHIEKNKDKLKAEGVLEDLELSVKSLESINNRIAGDPTVGRDKQIGHSFLFKVQTKSDLILVWKNEILPLLEEYYYGQYSRINDLLFNSTDDSKWLSKTRGICDFETYDDLREFLSNIYNVD
jgi:5-methylcytosine-specific restriction protein B